MNKYAAHQSVYFFTTKIGDVFPILQYAADTSSASRFSSFWMLGGLVKSSYLSPNEVDVSQKLKDKNFLIDMIVEDLNLNKPKFVFIDDRKTKNLFFYGREGKNFLFPQIEYLTFDYLPYFSTNKNFKTAWKNYHYFTTIKPSNTNSFFLFQQLFQLTVYERNS